ncbi:MAG: phosphatidate cytidylyltransferase [Flavobacteriaceae bacterium]|nr:phosphatidate cytidylyltransferase [Flavobacteriaceae bacterium]|tara:strand:- start:59573 stop:60373 length:801 start_codon:yes stop_codon:yes gene_type:complete
MSNFYQRGIFGLIYVVLFLSAILISEFSYVAYATLLGFFCLLEFTRIINFKYTIVYLIYGMLVYLIIIEDFKFLVTPILMLSLASSIVLMYQLFVNKGFVFQRNLLRFVISVRYIIFSSIFIILLPFLNGEYRPHLIIGILVMMWANDSFAYLVGKNFGKRKLFPSVSPKKTVEGFIGGFVFTLVAAACIHYFNKDLDLISWLVIGTIMSTIGTIGDLIESKFKRIAEVKDSGTLIPGHGGFFDRLDSLLFAAPFVYLYVHHIAIF